MKSGAMVLCSFTSAAKLWRKRSGRPGQGGIKLLDFSLSSIGWRRGLGRGGAFLLVSPLLGPLPTRSSRGEDGERRPCVRAYPGWFSSGEETSIRESNDEDSGDLAGRHWGRVSGDTADPRIAIEFPGGHNRCAGQVGGRA